MTTDPNTIDLESVMKVTKPSEEQSREHQRIATKLVELESAIVYAQQAKVEWLEVEPEILKHFCKGELPKVGYFIYKNIKLCLEGTAEEIAKRDRLTCDQIIYPKEGYMKIGVKNAR